MELKELLIFCSHKSDYLHCVVKIVLIAVLPNIMYHSQSALCCTKASQSVSQGGIFLDEVSPPPPKVRQGGAKLNMAGLNQSVEGQNYLSF